MNLYSIPVRELILIAAGYTFGCISTGYYLVRWRSGLDIRSLGSGSTGSKNVGKILGLHGFIITLAGDCAKGMAAMGLANYFNLPDWGVAGVMIAVMLGHIWPVQLRFRGGKGLATELGIMTVLDYRLALISYILALIGLSVGLGSASLLAAALPVPVVAIILGRSLAEVAGILAITLLVVGAHRENVRAFFASHNNGKGLRA